MKFIITEEDKKYIRGLYEQTTSGNTQPTNFKSTITNSNLTQQQLNSRAGNSTKLLQDLFNKKYSSNLPIDGNWMTPKYNETMYRFLTDSGITPYVCKKGDGYCPDDYEGMVTIGRDDDNGWIKYSGIIRPLIAQNSTQQNTQSKVNVNHDKSYDYKFEGGKYYYSLKGKNNWVEAKGNGLESIKKNVKFV